MLFALLTTLCLSTTPTDTMPPKNDALVTAVTATEPKWFDDYAQAYRAAEKEKKDLFIYFRGNGRYDECFREATVAKTLAARFVCLRVPPEYRYRGETLLSWGAFREMQGGAGFAVVQLHDDKIETQGQVISAHPFRRSRYGWVPDYGPQQVNIMLNLPSDLTLSQRSMIFALAVHPERPASIFGRPHRRLLEHARRHSCRQASCGDQHHNIGGCEHPEDAGVSGEIVAESWGYRLGEDENVLEASFSCVDSWRHSPGHWGAASRQHRYFGYDIERGCDGRWFATGIFAD